MADFSSAAPGYVPQRRSLLQRVQGWLRPGAAAAPQRLGALRPNGENAYIGEIGIFANTFVPVGWALCDGSTLNISEYEALFTLIGTTYGGDGVQTFNIPDLRGRVPLHQGTGTGTGTGSTYTVGQKGGAETVSLTAAQLPAHTHTVGASTLPGTTTSPQGAVPADSGSGSAQYTQATTDLVTQPAQTLGSAGGSVPHANMQPYLAVYYGIALEGIYPSQN